jgi:magnesium-transporting ATPase (P-type)
MRSPDQGSTWWLRPLSALLEELGTPGAGLTHGELRSRLRQYGPNEFRDRPTRSLLVGFLRRFRNPLVLILIAASVISALTGEEVSFLIIMVLMSVILDFVQEYRAGRAAQRLRQSVQIRAGVMWIIGPISSLFDFLTFYVLLAVLKANEVLFQTGWFVESLATQVLVIFVIRTRRNPLSSRPHAALAATSLAVVLTALVLPFTRLGHYFGFQAPPAEFLMILAVLVVAYLGIVEATKRVFYHHLGTKPR